ncbi:MAG: hypothetical protein ACREUP_09710, partial [Burkholderiales bacterium]
MLPRKRNMAVAVGAAPAQPVESADRPVQKQRTAALGILRAQRERNRAANASTHKERTFDPKMVEQAL